MLLPTSQAEFEAFIAAETRRVVKTAGIKADQLIPTSTTVLGQSTKSLRSSPPRGE
jgi:hypothetical protein